MSTSIGPQQDKPKPTKGVAKPPVIPTAKTAPPPIVESAANNAAEPMGDFSIVTDDAGAGAKAKSKSSRGSRQKRRPTETAVSSAQRGRSRPNRQGSNLAVPLVIGGGVLLVVIFGVVGFVAMSGGKKDKSTTAKKTKKIDDDTASTTTSGGETPKLVIDWAPADRVDAGMLINGRRYSIKPTGPIELRLQPGQYEIELERGSQRARHSLTLAKSSVEYYTPRWSLGEVASLDPIQPPKEERPKKPRDKKPKQPSTTMPAEEDLLAALDYLADVDEPPPTKPDPPKPTPRPEPKPPKPEPGDVASNDSGKADEDATEVADPPTSPLPDDVVAKVDPEDAPENDEPSPNATTDVEKKLLDKTVDILFWKGETLDEVKIIGVEPGKEPDSLAMLNLQMKRGTRSIRMPAVARIDIGKQVYSIEHKQENDTYWLFDVNAHLAEVDKNLRTRGHMLWPERTEQEQNDEIAEQKEFLEEVGKKFPELRLYETNYFLFYTDIPEQQVEFFVECLDKMYDELCKIFGVTGGKNIWRGKAIVLAFLQERQYHTFEQVVMRNPNSQGSAGLHHGFSNGKVIISLFRGDDPNEFAHTLVHETAHGFLHRYKSNIHIPSWINEGVAEWVGYYAVPQCKQVPMKEAIAKQILQQRRSLGGSFFSERRSIDGWQYGVAYQITKLMISMAPMRYGQFIDGIKEGKPVEQSLKDTYGWTFTKLAHTYGQAIGTPVRP